MPKGSSKFYTYLWALFYANLITIFLFILVIASVIAFADEQKLMFFGLKPGNSQGDALIPQLYQKTSNYLDEMDLTEDIIMLKLPQGIGLVFRQDLIFANKESNFKPQADRILQPLALFFAYIPNSIWIQCYPGGENPKPADTELSIARAEELRDYFNKKLQPEGKRVAAVSFGYKSAGESNIIIVIRTIGKWE
ncbi:hypothetical protein RDV78_03335 [Bacillota bacterium LX-D]|nr:hypothetical protein [Bacillota bacterium LX-D]